MGTTLLLYLAVTSSCWQYPAVLNEQQCIQSNPVKNLMASLSNYNPLAAKLKYKDIYAMLTRDKLNPEVIDKVAMTVECANQYNLEYNPILTIIDYSIPANQKRFWVYDLLEKKLLYHTYVSHGITSGALSTEFFSNKYNSKASSIGVYKTIKSYWGRDGLSLRLKGLEAGFNDNAEGRAIVMHGGWYVNEDFIQHYGRPGRSWGCPALPKNMVKPVINTIKEGTLMVVYYPTENWFVKSRYLTCNKMLARPQKLDMNVKPFVELDNTREEVLFLTSGKENETILAMPTIIYEQLFNKQSPVERMLRRRVENREFIALSKNEFLYLANNPQLLNDKILSELYFVKPEVRMERGYYKTHLKIVNHGKILALKTDANINNFNEPAQNQTLNNEAINLDKLYADAATNNVVTDISQNSQDTKAQIKTEKNQIIVQSDKEILKLQPKNHFVRWIGL